MALTVRSGLAIRVGAARQPVPDHPVRRARAVATAPGRGERAERRVTRGRLPGSSGSSCGHAGGVWPIEAVDLGTGDGSYRPTGMTHPHHAALCRHRRARRRPHRLRGRRARPVGHRRPRHHSLPPAPRAPPVTRPWFPRPPPPRRSPIPSLPDVPLPAVPEGVDPAPSATSSPPSTCSPRRRRSTRPTSRSWGSRRSCGGTAASAVPCGDDVHPGAGRRHQGRPRAGRRGLPLPRRRGRRAVLCENPAEPLG